LTILTPCLTLNSEKRGDTHLFNFTQYEVVLKVEEPLALPAYKGSILRGNFGATLKRL